LDVFMLAGFLTQGDSDRLTLFLRLTLADREFPRHGDGIVDLWDLAFVAQKVSGAPDSKAVSQKCRNEEAEQNSNPKERFRT
jgi:hypothetical protein